MRGLLLIYRPVHRPRCTDGIASEADFAGQRQRRRARRVLILPPNRGSLPEVIWRENPLEKSTTAHHTRLFVVPAAGLEWG